MKTRITVLGTLALGLAACGSGGGESPQEQRADQLREAADQSTPEAANQLEAIADQQEAAAQTNGVAPADQSANGAMPDSMSNVTANGQ
jgi:hypothetical protein